MKQFILWTEKYMHNYPRDCLSPGIAALVPNNIGSHEVVEASRVAETSNWPGRLASSTRVGERRPQSPRKSVKVTTLHRISN